MNNFFIDFISQVKYKLDLMSLSFRNLFLLALFCGIASTLSISSLTSGNHRHHMVKVHEFTTPFAAHQQSTTDPSAFNSNIQNILETISKSVQPKVPSIIETKNLPTFAFDKNTCDSLNDDQRKKILDKVKSTRDSVSSFKKGVTDDKVLADADNSIQYLNVI